MTFQPKRRNWKRIQPNNLRDAFRLCKDYATEKKRLSVPRIADEMGISEDLLYRYLSDGSMKAREIRVFERVCGANFVTNHLVSGAARVVIEIPAGKAADATDISELQAIMSDAVAQLIRFYRGEAEQDETESGLTQALQSIAWHRENVHKAEQPELDI